MSGEPVAKMRGFYDAISRGDFPAALDVLSPELEFRVPDTVPYGGMYRGREGFQAYVANAREHLEADFRIEADQFLEAGERVVVLGRLDARARGSVARFEAPFAHVWTMRDGKAARLDDYIDTARIVEALRAGSGR